MRKTLLGLAAIALAVLGPATAAVAAPLAAPAPCGTTSVAPTYQHVIWIWMENHSYTDIIGNTSQAPYINSIASACGLATNYHNATHPSLPNYLSATSGLSLNQLPTFSYLDCGVSIFCNSSAPSLFGQGETWKSYEESMPSNCATSDSGEYVARHNPALYYTSLSGCAANDVPYTQLASDLSAGTLPAFSFVTPNLIHDMHDGTVTDGDTWLADNLPTILNSATYRAGRTAVFLTWDEGTGGSTGAACATNTTDTSCRVATIVVSPSTPAGTTSGTLFNHYSLLGTTEQLLGLPALGAASSSTTLAAAFNL